MVKNALILSAGFGTRLRPITNDIPKALVPVRGKPIIDHIISQIKNAGINSISVTSHYLADKLEAHLLQKYGDEIHISHEAEILETGGGILNVMKQLNADELLVVNCDAFFEAANPLDDFVKAWNSKEMDALLMLRHEGANADFGLEDGKVNRNESDYRFLGVYIIKHSIFGDMGVAKFKVMDVLFDKMASSDHKLYAIEYKGDWSDIGSLEALKLANND